MKFENLQEVKARLAIAKARVRQIERYVRDIESTQTVVALSAAQTAGVEGQIDTLVGALDMAMTSLKEAQTATGKVAASDRGEVGK